jgi:murein DD-endopeptidase MepM/ murein hydrolase activator NlpD
LEATEPVNDAPISWIFPLNGEISRDYGYNFDPTFEDYRFHHGIDIMAEPGTAIYAVAEGKVILARDDGAWGGVLTLEHKNGWQSIYRCIDTTLQYGANPKAGDIIGYIIENAPSEAGQEAHLHFELMLDEENVDPEQWL